MISAIFENHDLAYVAYRIMKNMLEENGYKAASEIKGETRTVIMKKNGSSISISYKSMGSTDVRFSVEGDDKVIEDMMHKGLTAFLLNTASKMFNVKLKEGAEKRISSQVKSILDEIKKG